MFQLINQTPLLANLIPSWDRYARHQITCVMKAGFNFNINGELAALDSIEPILLTNHPNDIMPFKKDGELLLSMQQSFNHKAKISIYFNNGEKWQKLLKQKWYQKLFTKKHEHPFLSNQECPHGFNPPENFYNVAPDDQQFTHSFCGGELVCLQNIFDKEAIEIILPCLKPKIMVYTKHEEPINLMWDTLSLNLDRKTLHLTGRVGIPANFYDQQQYYVVIKD